MSEVNLDDYEMVETNNQEIGRCNGCAGEGVESTCVALPDCWKGDKPCIFKLKESPKPTRESLLAEIAELDRQKEIKERELRELSNKEQGDE